jgi:chlorobactene glucosyltransferase
MNTNKRFASLGLLTLGSIGATVSSVRAMQSPPHVPLVDATASPPPAGHERWPFVSVIVPARNEERNLPRLLSTLLSLCYPDYEVIVVDDQSTDGTPRVLEEWAARDPRLRVVRGAGLLPGWKGKPNAMRQGVEVARGEWLLFTDADTAHEPLSLGSTIAYALEHDVDLLTIGPCPELHTAWEKIIMPVAYEGIFALYPPYKVNDPKSRTAIANGQYILIRRDVYAKAGGIGRVKNEIAEDLEFGKAVKSDGHRLVLADGRHLMSVRMYTNLSEIWEGWSKNVVLSFGRNPLEGLLAVAGTMTLTVAPVLMARWALLSWRTANATGRKDDLAAAYWTSGLAGWVIAGPFVYRARMDRSLGLTPVWTLTQPVGAAMFTAIMLYSIYRLLTGRGVVWKGRTYQG